MKLDHKFSNYVARIDRLDGYTCGNGFIYEKLMKEEEHMLPAVGVAYLKLHGFRHILGGTWVRRALIRGANQTGCGM